MASEIKIEVDQQISVQNLCHGCLSQDRKLKPLSMENTQLYYTVLGQGMFGVKIHMVCWECEAMLRKLGMFQNQVLLAQNKLMAIQYNMPSRIESLSNLTVTTKDHYDLYYEYIEQTFIEINSDVKPPEHIILESSIQPSIETSQVKIEKLEPKPETSSSSDDDDHFEEDTSNFETELKTNVIKKEDKTKKDVKLKKYPPLKYHLKYAVIKNLNTKFDQPGPYFVEQHIDLEEVEESKPDPTQQRFKTRDLLLLDLKEQYIYLLRKNLNQMKSNSISRCLLCKKKMSNLEQLRTHWKSSHCALWRCTLCNTHCRKTGRVHHLRGQHTKVYSCTRCRRDFRCKYHFNLHFKKEHEKYICHHCGKISPTRSKIIRHMLATHADNYYCKICNTKFKDQYNLMRHHSVYHPEIINKKVDKEAAYCVECNRQFKSVELFKRHLFDSPKHTQRPTLSIPCPECGKIFTRKYYMTNHFNKEHMPENAKYKCTICQKFLANSSGLKRHYQNVHLKVPRDKNKICDICGRGFSTNRILANHRRTHTGERPYSCAYCSATFTQRTPMITHQHKCSFRTNYQNNITTVPTDLI